MLSIIMESVCAFFAAVVVSVFLAVRFTRRQREKYPILKKLDGKQLRLVSLFIVLLLVSGGIHAWRERQSEKTEEFTEHKLNEIAESVKRLGLDPKNLLERYPLGYVIFEVDYSNRVFPYKNQLLDKYELNWDVVGFTKKTPETFELRLPDIKLKDGSASLTNLVFSGPKRVGEMEGGGLIDSLAIWGRIIDIRKDGIVFLIGFEEIPMSSGKPNIPKK